MAFCDYCDCEICRTGDPRRVKAEGRVFLETDLYHAPTEFGDWICDVCWQYDEPVSWQHALGPTDDDQYEGYSPKIVGKFVRERTEVK